MKILTKITFEHFLVCYIIFEHDKVQFVRKQHKKGIVADYRLTKYRCYCFFFFEKIEFSLNYPNVY